MSDTDGLAAETRRLLDAATQGPWTRTSDTANWFTVPQPIQIDEADWGQEAQEDGAMCGYRIGTLADERAWRYADVELIAAAPRLLANWLARNEQTEAVEDDLGRIANENAALAGRLMAERDRLADENRALREAIRTHEDLHRPVGPDSPNGPIHMDGWPCCDDDRHLWAAADRGVTDGDRNEGERT